MSAMKNNNNKIKHKCVRVKVIFLIGMIELDHQMPAAKTSVNKVRKNTSRLFVLFDIIIANFLNILSLHFTVFINSKEY